MIRRTTLFLMVVLLAASGCAKQPATAQQTLGHAERRAPVRAVPATSLPPAREILAFARAQLPLQPIRMTGTLKARAPNGYVKRTRSVEMDLDWGAAPPRATYRLFDEKAEASQTLEIVWKSSGPEYRFKASGAATEIDPNTEIDGLGLTWADLSFSFLWDPAAQTEGMAKKLGRDCFVLSVPRAGKKHLRLWVEQASGRLFGAEERAADGTTQKIIKVVSVKEFDGLWMVKDLDVIRPAEGGRTTLRVDTVAVGTN